MELAQRMDMREFKRYADRKNDMLGKRDFLKKS